ncbi:MAG: glutathione S-transferase, partial [Ottowia sp.]
FFAAGPMEAAVTARALGLLAPPERRAMAGYGSYEDVMAAAELAVRAALARGGHLCGAFSAADLYLAGYLSYGMQFGTIEKRPLFEQYVQPLVSRPAAARANALDDALAQQLQAAGGAG